jgi:hypothetical protein
MTDTKLDSCTGVGCDALLHLEGNPRSEAERG